MTLVFEPAELQLALARVRRDHQVIGRVFVSRPAEWLVVDADAGKWLERLHAQIAAGWYVPGAPQVADVPKGKGAVRTGVLLSLADEVVYTACVGRVLGAIAQAFEWRSPHPDCSYLFRKLGEAEWLSAGFYCWKRFRERSLNALIPKVNYVVVADIAGYYDCIAHEPLLSALLAAEVDADVARFLVGTLLGRWAMLNGRGIPQGLSASDILAKLYLNSVDRQLSDHGYSHLRYVDDLRIFCDSHAHARRALLDLQVFLREKGLALQSAKTETLRPDKARQKFEGIQPVLGPLAKQYVASIAAAAGVAAEYLSIAEAEALLATIDDPPTDLLRNAYQAHLIDESASFDKTLFHYLVRRLGKARDRFALTHCLELLLDHPEETAEILNYLRNVDAIESSESTVLDQLSRGEAVYPYQHYVYLAWRGRQKVAASDQLLIYARKWFSEARAPRYLLSAARFLLARFGTESDLLLIKSHYGNEDGEVGRLEVACSLYRMEKTARNAFLGQVKRDGPLLASAVEAIKNRTYEFGVEAL